MFDVAQFKSIRINQNELILDFYLIKFNSK